MPRRRMSTILWFRGQLARGIARPRQHVVATLALSQIMQGVSARSPRWIQAQASPKPSSAMGGKSATTATYAARLSSTDSRGGLSSRGANRTPRRSAGRLMPATLLRSQIDLLKEPGADDDPLTIDIRPPVDRLAAEVIQLLGSSS
jgi:hypothetical protein